MLCRRSTSKEIECRDSAPDRYPEHEQLQQIVQCYLTPVLDKQLGGRHKVWSQSNNVSTLAGSMVQVYEQASRVLSTGGNCIIIIINYYMYICVYVELAKN